MVGSAPLGGPTTSLPPRGWWKRTQLKVLQIQQTLASVVNTSSVLSPAPDGSFWQKVGDQFDYQPAEHYWMKREGGATPQSLPGLQTIRSPEGSDEWKRSYRLFWMMVDLANRAQQFIL